MCRGKETVEGRKGFWLLDGIRGHKISDCTEPQNFTGWPCIRLWKVLWKSVSKLQISSVYEISSRFIVPVQSMHVYIRVCSVLWLVISSLFIMHFKYFLLYSNFLSKRKKLDLWNQNSVSVAACVWNCLPTSTFKRTDLLMWIFFATADHPKALRFLSCNQ